MSIIKITRTLDRDIGLKHGSIHDPFFLNLSKPTEIIPKETEVEFHVEIKKITLHWNNKKHIVPRCFVSILNRYLEKPLPLN